MENTKNYWAYLIYIPVIVFGFYLLKVFFSSLFSDFCGKI